MLRLFRFFIVLSLLVIASCSTYHGTIPYPDSVYLSATGEIQACSRLYIRLEELVQQQQVIDVQAARITGFPYLRTNRFLSSVKDKLTNNSATRFWIERLHQLDLDSRRIEIQNLKLSIKQLKELRVNYKDELYQRLSLCGRLLLDADLEQPDQIREIIHYADVADSYSALLRFLGFYPLSKLFIRRSVQKLHADIMAMFQQPEQSALAKGSSHYYYPLPASTTITQSEIADLIRRNSNNPLQIPLLNRYEREALFSKFAPVWNIDVVSDDDRFGAIYWSATSVLAVDRHDPSVYRFVSYTRVKNKTLLQLNYIIWFPSRPVTGYFDMLGGNLDGITWRVTLGINGRPVMYDAMHNCGCYHMFFPVVGSKQRIVENRDEEPILVAALISDISDEQRLSIRIASGSHYIYGIDVLDNDLHTDKYKFTDYSNLRALPLPDGGNLSMFATNGIVAGTSRKERWLLWPMGVSDPGAMRQWGHHAIAFVGKRHFDDPYLIEKYFEY